MTRWHLWHLCSILLLAHGVQSLRNVSLLVFPPAVQRGQDASLMCLYDLEGAPLYSVKWYRGNLEFYRYAPREKPPTKIFPFNGIHVDLSVSNETQVVLRRVGFNLSGNFSCEVTVDAPSFSTKTVYEQLLVVALPAGPPELYTEKERYDPGDILRANCSSPPSKPAASITFLLNNVPVGYPETKYHRTLDFLESSSQELTMQLFPSHFDQNYLDLTCTAHIGSLYRRSVQIRLHGRTKEPIPERVSSPSVSSRTSGTVLLLLITSVFLCSR